MVRRIWHRQAESVNPRDAGGQGASRERLDVLGFKRRNAAADALYAALVEQARRPVFYAQLGVPDTVDGRFEMIVLHMFLTLHRLKDEPGHEEFGQALFDTMFADMDRSLREMGVSDLSVGRHVKTMAKGFYGRAAAYESGLADASGAVLADALRRNVYGTVAAAAPDPAPLAAYVRASAAGLAAQPAADVMAGRAHFAEPAASGVH
jgi:cytochrome b pre-mRNA-processing protein 3